MKLTPAFEKKPAWIILRNKIMPTLLVETYFDPETTVVHYKCANCKKLLMYGRKHECPRCPHEFVPREDGIYLWMSPNLFCRFCGKAQIS